MSANYFYYTVILLIDLNVGHHIVISAEVIKSSREKRNESLNGKVF